MNRKGYPLGLGALGGVLGLDHSPAGLSLVLKYVLKGLFTGFFTGLFTERVPFAG